MDRKEKMIEAAKFGKEIGEIFGKEVLDRIGASEQIYFDKITDSIVFLIPKENKRNVEGVFIERGEGEDIYNISFCQMNKEDHKTWETLKVCRDVPKDNLIGMIEWYIWEDRMKAQGLADTIFKQLGGEREMKEIGLVPSVNYDEKRNGFWADVSNEEVINAGINRIVIVLDEFDLYDVQFVNHQPGKDEDDIIDTFVKVSAFDLSSLIEGFTRRYVSKPDNEPDNEQEIDPPQPPQMQQPQPKKLSAEETLEKRVNRFICDAFDHSDKDKQISTKISKEKYELFTLLNKIQGLNNSSALNMIVTEYIRNNRMLIAPYIDELE